MTDARSGWVLAIAVLAAAAAVLACAGAAAGATWVVDDDGGANFTSIQAAIDAANDGDTIEVRSGTYYENVEVYKELTLIGVDKNTTIINGDGSTDVVRVTADGCTISGFTLQSHKPSIVYAVKIRGEVATGSFTWTPVNFAGFYYDINADVGNETLTVITSGRTVEEGNLVYQTTPDSINFEYSNWGSYQVIGFMAEKYLAGYDENTSDDIKSGDELSLISDHVLSKVLIDEEKNHTISTGASLELEEDYELKIIQLDVNGNKAQLELFRDGERVDTKTVDAPATYVYKKNLGTVDGVPIIAIHIDSVFAATETARVRIDGIFQISDDCVSIEVGSDFGVMEVKSVSSSAIILENEDSVDLYEYCTEQIIMGDIYLVTADNDSLRFYPMVEHAKPGVYEIRGEVQYVAVANPKIIWDGYNFGSFCYDLDEDISTETLRVAANTINCSAGDRIIEENRLTYRTVPARKQYELYENEGCTVDSSNPGGDAFYRIEGWIGEPHVAINNRADKLCKLLIEFEDYDKKTLATGDEWALGRGFALTVRRIDLQGDSVWLSLSKNGKGLDNRIINASTGNEQDRVYTYTADIGGEKKIPVFSCYVDAVFRGTESNLVQVTYIFLIADHVLEIEAGDRYGAMEVITASSSEIILKNNGTTIDLGAGIAVPIMNCLSFKTADDGTTIRFYPFIEEVIGPSPITEIAGIGLNSTDNSILTDNKIRLSDCGIHLRNSTNNTLTNNSINSNNEHGIYLSSSSNNTITGNTANHNGNCGIKINSSSSNMLADNIMNSNSRNGIDLWYSSNNTLTGNTISDSRYNFGLCGWNDMHFDNNIDTTNLVNGKPIYYIKDASDMIIDSGIDAGTIYCIGCDNITVKDVILTNNGAGVLFWRTDNSTIEDVNVSKNDYGIYLGNSSNNTLTGNTVLENSRGIEVCNSSDHTLTDNTVSDNWEGINLRNSCGNNLTINNADSNICCGISLWNSGSNMLMYNTISNNWEEGVLLRCSSSNDLISNIASGNGDGISLWNSSSNLLNNNTASGNGNGIYIDCSNSNTLTENNASKNDYGICLWYSSNNTLASNTMSGNKYNFDVSGDSLTHYIQKIDTGNIVDGKPIYYWVDQRDKQIPGNAGFVGVVNSTNITVRDLTLTKNYEGVLFAYTENSRIENVTASDNLCGICLRSSSYNILSDNKVSKNDYGICLRSSTNNILSDNKVSKNDYGIGLWNSSDNTLTENNASDNRCGIRLYSSSNNTLTGNIASKNWYGDGIYLYFSGNNTLTENNASKNNYGICLWYSGNNTLTDNIASNNDYRGIRLSYSSNNTLASNAMSGNKYNFDVSGDSLSHYIQKIDTGNIVDGKPIYYWVDQRDKQIPGDAGFVGVVNSTNITVRDLTLMKNYEGVLFAYTENSRIENVTASDNGEGIYLRSSNKNTLTGNTASDNDCGIRLRFSSNNTFTSNTAANNWCGIDLWYSGNNTLASNTASDNDYGIGLYSSGNNTLYHNNLINRKWRNAYDTGTNQWDSGAEGNYYSNYNGADPDGDGISNTPYQIPGGASIDHFPLMQPWTVAGAEWHVYPGAGTPIQTAIDGAEPGDTIYVHAGEYCENVDVNKRLTLIGEGADVVIVRAADADDHLFEVTADWVDISGFAVTRTNSHWSVAGIYLGSDVDHCNISDNDASNNTCGIWLEDSSNNMLMNNDASNNGYGIRLDHSSSGNTLIDNNASDNEYGICLWYSSSNTLCHNNASDNSYGIHLYFSSNSMLTNNTMSGNVYNFGVWSYSLSEYIQDIDTSNTVDGKPIYYWVDQQDKQIPDDAGFVGVVDSTNITVSDLILTNNRQGVLFAYTENSRTENVTASNNELGIRLYSSSENTLTNNTASDNHYGIRLSHSNINMLMGNTASDNEWCGIRIDSSSENTLADTNASNNDDGIHLSASSNNTLKNTTMSRNAHNFGVDGSIRSHYAQNIDTSNKVDGKPIYYWVDQQDKQIPCDAGFVGVVNSTNITVRDLTLTKNHEGVLFTYTENSRIENVTASNNEHGIRLYSSSNNTITDNTASNNDWCGIYIDSSSNNTLIGNSASNNDDGICLDHSSNNTLANNTASDNEEEGIYLRYSSNNTLANNTASNNDCGIRLYRSSSNMLVDNIASDNRYGIYLYSSGNNTLYHNNLVINTYRNAYDYNAYGSPNQWDSGAEGNYYSDYTGTDNNTDGIGEDPHPIPGGSSIDRFPLMQPWAGDTPQIGDLNGDNQITPADAAIALAIAAGVPPSCDAATLAAADVSGDNRVTSLDALMILQAVAGSIEL